MRCNMKVLIADKFEAAGIEQLREMVLIDRAAVLASIPELARVAAPGGCVVLLVAEDMYDPVLRLAAEADLAAEREFRVRRQGKLLAKALFLRKP